MVPAVQVRRGTPLWEERARHMRRSQSVDDDGTPRKRLLPSGWSPPMKIRQKWSHLISPFHFGKAKSDAISSTSHTPKSRLSLFKRASFSSPALVSSERFMVPGHDIGVPADREAGGRIGTELAFTDGQLATKNSKPRSILLSATSRATRTPGLSDIPTEAATNVTVRPNVTPAARPYLYTTPPVSCEKPMRANTFPFSNSSSCGDLFALAETEEPDEEIIKTPDELSPASSAQSVWLCSGPNAIRTKPFSGADSPSPTPVQMERSASASAITTPCAAGSKLVRPFITRAMTTGRLAKEFDTDGRVICLSVHSERAISDKEANVARPGVKAYARTHSLRSQSPLKTAPVPLGDGSVVKIVGPARMHGVAVDKRRQAQVERGVMIKTKDGYTQVGRDRARLAATGRK